LQYVWAQELVLMPEIASGVMAVPHSRIRELADVAFEMDDVLALHFGESNMPTPSFIKAAAEEAMAKGYTFYTENAGLPSLRAAIAAQYADLHGVDVIPEEVLVTASGVQALNVSIQCMIDPGDEAIVLTPNWPNASAIVTMFGGRPVEVPFGFDGVRFVIDFEAVEAALTPKTRLLIYTSPSNPLGWVATVDEQKQLLDFCRMHGLWLLADEVYERLFFLGHVAPSIRRLCEPADAVVVVQSFSKSYCMTGWRLGWVLGGVALITKAAQLNEFIVSHAPSMVQRAGEIALLKGESFVVDMVDRLKEDARFCAAQLEGIAGVSVPSPDGAFYLFPRVDGLADSFDFALRMLKETRVSVAPGVAFGNGGEGAFRICYAADHSVLEPAMEHIVGFLVRGL